MAKKGASAEATESLALKALCVEAFTRAREAGDVKLADELLWEWTSMVSVNEFDVKAARRRLLPLLSQAGITGVLL